MIKIFAYFSFVLSNFLADFFGENILKIITSVLGPDGHLRVQQVVPVQDVLPQQGGAASDESQAAGAESKGLFTQSRVFVSHRVVRQRPTQLCRMDPDLVGCC
jgi:hypothetical protein